MAHSGTEERRARVRQLWGKPDKAIAEILLDEGFEVDCGRTPKTRPARDAFEAKRVESMRRKVGNDRDYWRQEWKKRRSAPTTQDANIAREEHIASLESDIEEIHELLDDATTKPTAKAMLIGEKRQTRALIAKARGVEDGATPDDEGQDGRTIPFIGAILDLGALSEEARKKIEAEWKGERE